MTAKLSDRHCNRTCLQVGPVDFTDQPGNYVTRGFSVGILFECAYHPLAVDAFPVRSFLRPTELPYIRSFYPVLRCEAALLHTHLLDRSSGAGKMFSLPDGNGYVRMYEREVRCFATAAVPPAQANVRFRRQILEP